MNTTIARSLLRDAYYQVVDNLGFRILAVLFLLPALFLLLVGFREDGIWIARYWRWDYADWLPDAAAAARALTPTDIAEQRLKLLESLVDVVLYAADQYGTLFGIAAIAFFVPQMLERGAADVVFSKPVSRLALLLSRYVAGLVFVGLLTLVLVGGMFVGLWLTSDYVEFGLLWSVPTLVYSFAVFHAISCTIGVFTRSSIAAILLTIVFMPFNCGMSVWYESHAVQQHEEAQRVERGEAPRERDLTGMALDTFVDAYHLAMPKTSDGMLIAKKLRKRVERQEAEFSDEELGLSVAEAPSGFTRDVRSSFHREGVAWIAPHPSGGGEASWRFKRESVERAGKRSDVVKQLRKDLGVEAKLVTLSGVSANRFEWREKRGEEERLRRKWVAQLDDTLLLIDYDAEAKWAEDAANEHAARVFAAGWTIEAPTARRLEAQSYDGLFGWDAPWRFNAALSVGTTLLFIVAMLALGWWRLARIDF